MTYLLKSLCFLALVGKSLNNSSKGGEDPQEDTLNNDIISNYSVNYQTWLAASASILVVSLCGVFGVLVVPIMQKLLYQYLLQFLIAMAIGSLIGDALLHLLPHALLPDDHDHDDLVHTNQDGNHDLHNRAVWIGFVATVSIIGFFFLEKSINFVGVLKKCKKSKLKQDPRDVKVVREGHKISEEAKGGEKCMIKYSKYCVKDFDIVNHEEDPGPIIESAGKGYVTLNDDVLTDDTLEREKDTVIISQHEVDHHGHSHVHSHLHSAPKNISTVAWMVVMGDGIHNLADGLAIGAAFSHGLVDGLSTSVAVLCHELPHEIGDFAMLIKAGMTLRQAIFFNFVSSFLAIIGMVLGILLGTITGVTPWIFSMTAGIFLYVALVDMVPELSSGHAHPITKDNHGRMSYWVEVGVQLFGMCVGVAIMLVIALYEDKMLILFGGESETDQIQ